VHIFPCVHMLVNNDGMWKCHWITITWIHVITWCLVQMYQEFQPWMKSWVHSVCTLETCCTTLSWSPIYFWMHSLRLGAWRLAWKPSLKLELTDVWRVVRFYDLIWRFQRSITQIASVSFYICNCSSTFLYSLFILISCFICMNGAIPTNSIAIHWYP